MGVRVRKAAVAALTLLVLLQAQAAVAAPPYPSALPDFSHPASALPGTPLFNPTDGSLDRPLLVIYLVFPDLPANSGQDAAWLANRFFGNSFGTVTDYLSEVSNGELTITPAAESSASATTRDVANDGVVMVQLSPLVTYDDFKIDQNGDGKNDAYDDALRNGFAYQLADTRVDYSSFDSNGDGVVDDRELLTVVIIPSGAGSGAGTRGVVIPGGGELDGVTFAKSSSGTGTGTNNITNAHELGHQAGDMVDLYGLGAGFLALGGPTISGSEIWWNPNAFEKMHWGWITPTVVDQDGFQQVGRYDTTNEAFVLYDPGRPIDPIRGVQNDYFIVENRQRTLGTYEANASDSGLVIWRTDESVWPSPNDGVRPIELMLPDGTIRAPGCGDSDLDGLVDEDPPGGLQIIGGKVDIDGDGAITESDDGTYIGRVIIDGGFDINKDGVVNGDDDATRNPATPGDPPAKVGYVDIINGSVDVNGDGSITSADNGDPWQNIDNDGDNGTLNSNGIDDDRDGTVDEANEGIDEDAPNSGCYGGSPMDAWDPSDPLTPQRTMQRKWQDGTPARVSIRAIGNRSENTCAYFDVRGPGVMIDTYALSNAPAAVINNGGTQSFSFPVMNTNDAGLSSDTFSFTIEVPEGWSATTETLTLAPTAPATVTIDVTAAPDAPAGTVSSLKPVGRSTSVPTIRGEACEDFDVRVRSVPPAPDHLEPNNTSESATEIDFSTNPFGAATTHDHFDSRILSSGLSAVRSTAEVWTTDISNLNLHSRDDVDMFRALLPDLTHTGLQECGSVEVSPASGLTERITFTGMLTISVVSPYHDGPPINAADEYVTTGSVPSSGTDFTRTVLCPRTEGYDEVAFWFGAGGVDRSRANFPGYDLHVEYKIAVERVPDASKSWWILERESRGFGAAGSLPCLGGFFPACKGGPSAQIDVAHPILPGRDCLADGCPDFFAFHWAGKGSFNMDIQSLAPVSLKLFDAQQLLIGQAFPPAQQPPVDAIKAFGQHLMALTGIIQLSAGPTIHQVLSVPDLPPGFYVLVVSGPETEYSITFDPPPPPPDADDDELVDAFDYCPSQPEDVDGFEDADGCPDADNDGDGVLDDDDNCPAIANAEQSDANADGYGDACSVRVTVDIKPGSDENSINLKSKGVISVVILGSAVLDIETIDAASLTFGPGNAIETHGKGHVEDTDHDGRLDLVLHFETTAAQLPADATQACISGKVLGGIPIVGCDTVSMVGNGGSKPQAVTSDEVGAKDTKGQANKGNAKVQNAGNNSDSKVPDSGT